MKDVRNEGVQFSIMNFVRKMSRKENGAVLLKLASPSRIGRFYTFSFYFRMEAGLSDCPIDGNMVPPGALVKCILKGLKYLEMEANLSNRKADLDEDFSFIRPLDLITKDANELRQMITERRKNRHKNVVKVINRKGAARSRGVSEKGNLDNEKEHEKYRQLGQSSSNAVVKDTEMV